MRFSVKQYALLLYELVFETELKSLEDIIRLLDRFLELVYENGDSHRIGEIYRAFEKHAVKKKNIKKVFIEFGSEEPVNREFVRMVRDILTKKGETAMITSKINPSLISGVRVNYNNEQLIEASFRKMLNGMFNYESRI